MYYIAETLYQAQLEGQLVHVGFILWFASMLVHLIADVQFKYFKTGPGRNTWNSFLPPGKWEGWLLLRSSSIFVYWTITAVGAIYFLSHN